MRKRKHFIGLWLNDTEYGQLSHQCTVTGLSASALVRQLIMGVELQPRPPDTYTALLRELSAIGNNINQIAKWANAKQNITEDETQTAVALIRKAWRLVRNNL